MTDRYWINSLGAIHDNANQARLYGDTPVVVIDPEDREQVERARTVFRDLDCLVGDPTEVWQEAFRALANPTPQAEAYRHYVTKTTATTNGAVGTSLCGKVWRLNNGDPGVTIAGDCPECAKLLAAGWAA